MILLELKCSAARGIDVLGVSMLIVHLHLQGWVLWAIDKSSPFYFPVGGCKYQDNVSCHCHLYEYACMVALVRAAVTV